MTAATSAQVAEFGAPLVEHMLTRLGAVAEAGYEQLAEIRNLAGDATGCARVYKAARLHKLTHLSIDIMPGARYFNIVIAPEPHIDAPRFAHEGMVSTHGSQVSLDLYYDQDLAANIREFVARSAGLTEIYNEAKASDIPFVPSRQVHMRAFCSPHFLNVFGATGEQLPTLADFAMRYFNEWCAMFDSAAELDAAVAAERAARRRHMADTVIELDPDRNMVVQVYGEDIVAAIEQAVMY